MSNTIVALGGFALWTLILVLSVATFRMVSDFVLKRGIPLNCFKPDGSDVPGLGQRLTRAHLNCLEVLPIFAAVVLIASMANQMALLEPTVMYILYARVAQSVVHAISTSFIPVLIRATFFIIQLALLASYIWQIIM
ncbi:MAG: hypothetical protein CMH97_11350 [Oceanospirillaceae bacterium]|nr:hypothetical protein [Oceanospirillaceae bacterium]|tara:strand:+ start:462 stop:872 length:411 start_codon:yes stop_codon:yes gene_type:complete